MHAAGAMLSLGFAFYFVNARATSEAEAELRRGLNEAGKLVDPEPRCADRHLTRLARLVADLPKLKAAVATGDPPTVQPLGRRVPRSGEGGCPRPDRAAWRAAWPIRRGCRRSSRFRRRSKTPESVEEISTFVPHSRGVVQVVSVPIFIERDPPDVLGRLTVGFFLDDRFAEQIKRLTASEIAFGAGNRILASTLSADSRDALASVIGAHDIATVRIGDEDFLALARPLVSASADATSDAGDARGTDAALTDASGSAFNTIRTGLEGALVFTAAAGDDCSAMPSPRTATRPLSAITIGDARRRRDRRSHEKGGAAQRAVGRRRRAPARLDVQHADRIGRAVSRPRPPSANASRRSAGLDGDRARDPAIR